MEDSTIGHDESTSSQSYTWQDIKGWHQDPHIPLLIWDDLTTVESLVRYALRDALPMVPVVVDQIRDTADDYNLERRRLYIAEHLHTTCLDYTRLMDSLSYLYRVERLLVPAPVDLLLTLAKAGSVRPWLEQAAPEPAAQQAAKNGKPDPLPLRRELPPPDAYPIEVLGPILAPMARALREVVKAPDAICGQSVLAAAAVVVQPHGDVSIDGRTYPLSMYFVGIADSGDRKTTADAYAIYPLRQWEKKYVMGYEADYQTFKDAEEAYRRDREEALRKAKGRSAKEQAIAALGSPPKAPLEPLFLVQEPTYEGLIKLLLSGRPSVGLFSSEGGRFIYGYGMSVEQQVKTAAGLSDLWDGRPVNRVRAGDTTVMLYGRRVSMHLLAQPRVAMHLLGNQSLLDQGLLSRCLVAWPTSLAGSRVYKAYDVTESDAVKLYNARLTQILDTSLSLAEGTQNSLEPRKLPLHSTAKREWVKFHDHVEAQLGPQGDMVHVKGFASKLAEHALRLAGVLTLVGNIEATDITKTAIGAGITLAEFYVGEALRLFHHAQSVPELDLAEQVYLWAKRFRHIHLAQVYQYGPSNVRDVKTARQVVSILEDHGWLSRVDGGMQCEGTFKKDVWEVHQ